MKTYADPEAQAEIDRLRKVLLAEWEKDRKTYAALTEKVEAIERVRSHHAASDGSNPYCVGCGETDGVGGFVNWPCLTVRLLDGAK